MKVVPLCENCCNFVEDKYCGLDDSETSAHDTCDEFEVSEYFDDIDEDGDWQSDHYAEMSDK